MIYDQKLDQFIAMDHKSPITRIYDELLNLKEFESIIGILFFRVDGTMLRSIIPKESQRELLPTLVWIKDVISKVSSELSHGVRRVFYARNKHQIFFYKAGLSAILVCVLREYANTGLLSIEIDRNAQTIKELLKILSPSR